MAMIACLCVHFAHSLLHESTQCINPACMVDLRLLPVILYMLWLTHSSTAVATSSRCLSGILCRSQGCRARSLCVGGWWPRRAPGLQRHQAGSASRQCKQQVLSAGWLQACTQQWHGSAFFTCCSYSSRTHAGFTILTWKSLATPCNAGVRCFDLVLCVVTQNVAVQSLVGVH